MMNLKLVVKFRAIFLLAVMLYFAFSPSIPPWVTLGLAGLMVVAGIDARIPTAIAAIFLIVAMLLLQSGVYMMRAESWTIHSFYFLCIAILIHIVELLRNSTEQNEKIQ